ncbi:MAG: protein-glutamate O-methyltransferase CheR [Acidobacteria bacterium]|nr:protein-glutamate O-methyltransferase CheR [Acidobacteriota bacterium]
MSQEIAPMTREEQALFNEVLSREFGLHFPDGKRQILQSRLEPRLRDLRLRRFLDYYLKLQCELGEERDHLVRRVTNNETYFFREKAQFDALFDVALPGLLEAPAHPGKLRLLSAGCSSGEEPYTLAIYARQNRFRLGTTEVQVEAFDIDTDRLALAEAGEYQPRSLRTLDPERTGYFFRRPAEDRFVLKEPFREGVRFRRGNIVDPASFNPQGSYDALFCRNVLIYFSDVALHRAIENFARALRPGGILFLGHSESIIGLSPHFETLRLDRCIAYRRNPR